MTSFFSASHPQLALGVVVFNWVERFESASHISCTKST